MKLTKKKIIVGIVMFAVLAAVFWWGGNAPDLKGWNLGEAVGTANIGNNNDTSSDSDSADLQKQHAEVDSANEQAEQTEENAADTQNSAEQNQADTKQPQNSETPGEKKFESDNHQPEVKYEDSKIIRTPSGAKNQKGNSKTDLKGMYDSDSSVKKDIPKPINPETAKITTEKRICTLTVKCSTILDNMDMLKPEKHSLVPDNGIIFPEKEVMFYEGESVFNVLLREMKRAGIHMEYVNTPIYKSAYIEGINNLYEFDCGELSGWIYRVNGLKPDYGCSRYPLSEGDRIEFDYTCNLGDDIH